MPCRPSRSFPHRGCSALGAKGRSGSPRRVLLGLQLKLAPMKAGVVGINCWVSRRILGLYRCSVNAN